MIKIAASRTEAEANHREMTEASAHAMPSAKPPTLIGLSVHLGADELKTRELFARVEWSPANIVIAHVFRAMHHAALTSEDVHRIGRAMYPASGLLIDQVEDALNELVRGKTLRRHIPGRGKARLYEVNY